MKPPVIKVAVQDANVLIDLEIAGLLDLWFQVGIETHTTDLIRAELEKGGHAQALACFKCGQVIEHTLSFEEIMKVSELEREVGNKAKFNDCSVLFLAMKLDAMLLSGDKPLRKAGTEKQIEVHGTLWMFDRLVELQLMSGKMAAAKLEHLRKNDRFLPEIECQIRLQLWRGS